MSRYAHQLLPSLGAILSLVCIQNAFVEVMHPKTSIYEIFGPDPLHCAESGLEGAHDWPWTIKFLDSAMAEVDSKCVPLTICNVRSD